MAITYDAPTNTLTVTDGTYDFADLYDADVAGGWGVVTRSGGTQYLVDANITIGSDADLIDSKISVQIGTNSNLVVLTIDGLFQLGSVPLYDGGNLILYLSESSYSNIVGVLSLYGVQISKLRGTYLWRTYQYGIVNLDNVLMFGVNGGLLWFVSSTGSGTVSRCSFSGDSGHVMFIYTNVVDFQDIKILGNAQYGVAINIGSDVELREVDFSDGIFSVAQIRYLTASKATTRFYDCSYDRFLINSGLTSPKGIHLDYKTFNLKVLGSDNLPLDNATVTLTSVQGDILTLSTDVNGEIPTQQLQTFSCTHKDGIGTGTGLAYHDYDYYSPWEIRVEYSGYYDYNSAVELLDDNYKLGASLTVSMKTAPVVDKLTPTFHRKEIQGGCCD